MVAEFIQIGTLDPQFCLRICFPHSGAIEAQGPSREGWGGDEKTRLCAHSLQLLSKATTRTSSAGRTSYSLKWRGNHGITSALTPWCRSTGGGLGARPVTELTNPLGFSSTKGKPQPFSCIPTSLWNHGKAEEKQETGNLRGM